MLNWSCTDEWGKDAEPDVTWYPAGIDERFGGCIQFVNRAFVWHAWEWTPDGSCDTQGTGTVGSFREADAAVAAWIVGRKTAAWGNQPSTADRPAPVEQRILDRLVAHLGSDQAARAWLGSPHTGYPTTATDAIHRGHAAFVLADLEKRFGPGSDYA
jgi:hypothetical protein